MKFKCIKTVEFPWNKQDSRYPFIEGKIYESWDKVTSRTNLDLINENGENHCVGIHWLHWSFAEFYREHFVKVG